MKEFRSYLLLVGRHWSNAIGAGFLGALYFAVDRNWPRFSVAAFVVGASVCLFYATFKVWRSAYNEGNKTAHGSQEDKAYLQLVSAFQDLKVCDQDINYVSEESRLNLFLLLQSSLHRAIVHLTSDEQEFLGDYGRSDIYLALSDRHWRGIFNMTDNDAQTILKAWKDEVPELRENLRTILNWRYRQGSESRF